MNNDPMYCGVILAAGASTRMGRSKALLAWPPENREGSTFLSCAISSLKLVTDTVVVVVASNMGELSLVATSCGARIVVNPDPGRGHFSSMQVGLGEVAALGRATAIITPVDRPPLAAPYIQQLCRAYEQRADGVWAIIPTYKGHRGHPLIAGPELVRALLGAGVESNAHEVLTAYADHILQVEVDDPAVTLNVNTPQDYDQLSVLLQRK